MLKNMERFYFNLDLSHFSLYFSSDFITAGGNYMADGYGIAASSDLIFEELKEVMTTLQAMPKKQAMNDCKINSKKILNELLR